MIVLGIDPGTSATGYGLIETRRAGLLLLEAGVLRAPAGPLVDRVRSLCDGLDSLLDRSRPVEVALESLFHARNVRSALTLAQARGAFLLTVSRRGLPVAEYAPREVKKALTGQGAAAKQQVREMVSRLLGDRSASRLALDASDALAVAICHAHTAASPLHRLGRGGR